jgi:hypothetical protein
MTTAEFYRTQTGIIDNVKMPSSLMSRRKHKHLGGSSLQKMANLWIAEDILKIYNAFLFFMWAGNFKLCKNDKVAVAIKKALRKTDQRIGLHIC